MNPQPQSIYQRVIDRTKSIGFQTQFLAQNIEKLALVPTTSYYTTTKQGVCYIYYYYKKLINYSIFREHQISGLSPLIMNNSTIKLLIIHELNYCIINLFSLIYLRNTISE